MEVARRRRRGEGGERKIVALCYLFFSSKTKQTCKDVEYDNLKLIYNLLKVRGFTIEGAKEKLKTESKKIEIVQKLEKIKSKLEIIEKEL